MMLLRENMVRSLGGLGQPTLFTYSLSGTKRLVQAYVNEIVDCINAISLSVALPLHLREQFLADSRQAYGRSALMLSGGLGMGACACFLIFSCLNVRKGILNIIL